MAKAWCITGASSGFGRESTTAAIERFDRAASTARKLPAGAEPAQRLGEDAALPIGFDAASHPVYAREAAWMQGCFALVTIREGDRSATRESILRVVNSEDPPRRLLAGAGAHDFPELARQTRLAELCAQEDVSVAAHSPLSAVNA